MLTLVQKREIMRLILTEFVGGGCGSCLNKVTDACYGCKMYSHFIPRQGIVDHNRKFFKRLEEITNGTMEED